MIKRNLMKAVMMGLCMAALSTSGTAFAMVGAGSTGSVGVEVMTPELEALYAKQSEIDKILLKDHVRDIELKGFMVNTTGVIDDVIEIGISPYSEENAAYIYELVGKEDVKVVEFDMSVIYQTSAPLVAPDETTSSDADGVVTIQDTDAAEAEDGKMEIQIESVEDAEDDKMEIQIESVADGSDEKLETVSAPVDDIRTMAPTNAENKENDLSTSVIILVVAGGAALIGGAVLYSGRKKGNK